ncbi:MAG: AAA family ATPase [Candidatus Thiodiazotropha sp. (ex Epidulcina cf. delphinae)]|nr:AAA family ATPase [Candidatus Thiodiazotropha sp. (ex Epidulcina cf. delphinae)]
MIKRLILASAGAGKSELISKEALERAADGEHILILTYTESNQKELFKKICRLNGYKPTEIVIKGWFTFLLEDMIRPYQRCIFSNRIPGINFNKAGDPNKRGGRNIPGTAEKIDGKYNSIHYLTKASGKAHTSYLSKLSYRIYKESKKNNIGRLSGIYDAVFIDEVQDLVGWDFDIIEAISKIDDLAFTCVGDFRQTVYTTHPTTKTPKTNTEKRERFESIGFATKPLNVSWRCIQPICDFAHLVHADENLYPKTISNVTQVPDVFANHTGVFTVSEQHISSYIQLFEPVILRLDKGTRLDLCEDQKCYNFGVSKGLGFERVLIIPTENHRKFLRGETGIFDDAKTDAPQNTLYVISTRAHYSVAFLFDEDSAIDVVRTWQP